MQPTIAELLELIMQAESSIDTQFQFWLTVTFATIVASFASKGLLTGFMRVLVLCLYLGATIVFWSRWQYDANDIFIYSKMLAEQGYENSAPIVTGYSRRIVMALGTLATVYFLFLSSKTPSDTK